jgi:hypothetical protein
MARADVVALRRRIESLKSQQAAAVSQGRVKQAGLIAEALEIEEGKLKALRRRKPKSQ